MQAMTPAYRSVWPTAASPDVECALQVGLGNWELGVDVSSSTSDPPFKKVAIIGLGLIGGSIALALRERWPSIRIAGVDRQPVLAHALGSGAIDRGVESAAAIGEADLVILA